jgi:LPS-assembly protein
VGYRHDAGGYFIEPRMGLRYTVQPGRRCARQEQKSDPDPAPSECRWWIDFRTPAWRRLPADAGTRVFYGYVPFREQDGIPLFDTAEREFSFDSLFTTRRFVGADRVGDTHQVTTALTSRIIDPATGAERLSLSAGQITYLDDRRVRLRPTDPPLQENRSELAAEALARLGRNWRTQASVIFDTGRERARLATLSVAYNPHERALLNLGYRLREDRIEQTDISGFWPLSNRVQASDAGTTACSTSAPSNSLADSSIEAVAMVCASRCAGT